jgi:hypothetical protein
VDVGAGVKGEKRRPTRGVCRPRHPGSTSYPDDRAHPSRARGAVEQPTAPTPRGPLQWDKCLASTSHAIVSHATVSLAHVSHAHVSHAHVVSAIAA